MAPRRMAILPRGEETDGPGIGGHRLGSPCICLAKMGVCHRSQPTGKQMFARERKMRKRNPKAKRATILAPFCAGSGNPIHTVNLVHIVPDLVVHRPTGSSIPSW